MDVLTSARQLAQAIQDSEEYRTYQRARQSVDADPAARDMVRDFRRKSLEIQKQQWAGQEPDSERMNQLERMFELLNYNPTVRDFLAAELKLASLVAEAQKVISDAVDVWINYGDETEDADA
ncbi:MAG: YlbF family regulator [Chloroflexota bacterium]